jgi:two-component system chemotaxis response regulator CheV
MSNENTTFEIDNELQLLEFLVRDDYFGINIAKVSEIIRYNTLTPVPSSPPEIEGVFMHRDKLVTVIDLHKVLKKDIKESDGQGLLIVCDFEKLSVAFHVSAVNGIQRLSWSAIEKPPTVAGGNNADQIATGIAKLNEKMIMILDFEKIVCDLNNGQEFEVGEVEIVEHKHGIDYSKQIVIAEDSILLNKVVVEALKKNGFKVVRNFFNGLDAWDYVRTQTPATISAIITDIEMPQMDGLTFCRFVKADKVLNRIPVFLFSSLIHENIRQHGDKAGANGQFARSQLNALLVTLMDTLLSD